MTGVRHGSYAFSQGRLGALRTEFLGADDWGRLLGSSDWPGQRRALLSTPYESWIKDSPEETAGSIRSAIAPAAHKIERSVPAEAARFIHAWRRRGLLRTLRTILRGKALGLGESEIRGRVIGLESTEGFRVDLLLGTPDLDSAFDLLESYGMRGWIRAARHVYKQDPTMFGLDSALDRLYYPELQRQLVELHPSDQKPVGEMLALEIDQVNLLWLLRYRLNYRLSPAETYYLLVPANGHISSEQLKRLAQEHSLEAILDRLDSAPLRQLLRGAESVWQIEVALWRHRARMARQTYRRAAFTLGAGLALLLLRVIESRDIVAVLNGTQLGVPTKEIEEQLVGVQHA